MPVTATTRVVGSSPAIAQLIDAGERRSGIRLPLVDTTPAETELRLDPTVAAAEGYTLAVDDPASSAPTRRAFLRGADPASALARRR